MSTLPNSYSTISEPSTPYSLSRSGSFSHASSSDLPNWVPDADAKECMSCGKPFGFARRRHHCRNCGWCICSSCSPNKFVLSHLSSSVAQRVCNGCFSNLHQVAQIRQRATGMTHNQLTQQMQQPLHLMPFMNDQSAGFYSQPSQQASPKKSSTMTDSLQLPTPTHEEHSISPPPKSISPGLPTAASIPAATSFASSSFITPSPVAVATILSPTPVPASSGGPVTFSTSADEAPRRAPSPAPLASNPSAIPSSNPLADKPQMPALNIPDWTYLFKPFSGNKGEEVSVGRLGVTVHAASDLPQLDFILKTNEPYVKARLGAITKQTHTVMASSAAGAANPTWDVNPNNPSQASPDGNGTNFLLFDVSNVLETLRIEVWEHYNVGKDGLVGTVDIPLESLVQPANVCNSLSGNNPKMSSYYTQGWFDLQLSKSSRNKAKQLHNQAISVVSTLFNPLEWSQMSSTNKAKKLAEIKRKKLEEGGGSTKGSDAASSAESDFTAGEDLSSTAKIQLELAYSFSKVGEFWCHFTPLAESRSAAAGGETAASSSASTKKAATSGKASKKKEDDTDGSDGEEEDEATEALLLTEVDLDASATSSSSQGKSGETQPFQIQVSYELLRKCLALLDTPVQAITSLINALSTSLSPPFLTSIFLLVALLLAFQPSLILPALQILLLRFMAWNYIYRVWYGGKPQVLDDEWREVLLRNAAAQTAIQSAAASAAGQAGKQTKKGGAIVSALQTINPLNLVLSGNKKEQSDAVASLDAQRPGSSAIAADLATLNRVLLPQVQAALAVMGVPLDAGENSLDRFQASWASLVAKMDVFMQVLTFQKPQHFLAGQLLMVLLLCTTIYSIMFPQAYLCLFLGSIVLLRQTIPGQKCEWLVLSTLNAIRESAFYNTLQQFAGKQA